MKPLSGEVLQKSSDICFLESDASSMNVPFAVVRLVLLHHVESIGWHAKL